MEVRPKVPKTLRGHSFYNEKLNLISVIPLMLRNAVLVQSEESPRGLKSHLLVCKVRFSYDPNKTRYFVALIIREDGNGRLYYEHELTEIKEEENILRGHNPVSSPTFSVLTIIQNVVYSSGFRKNFEKICSKTPRRSAIPEILFLRRRMRWKMRKRGFPAFFTHKKSGENT